MYSIIVKLSYHTMIIADLIILVGVSVNESVAHGLRRYVIGTVVSWSVSGEAKTRQRSVRRNGTHGEHLHHCSTWLATIAGGRTRSLHQVSVNPCRHMRVKIIWRDRPIQPRQQAPPE